MKVYYWKNGGIALGVRISEYPGIGKAVSLGEAGKNRRLTHVRFDKFTPPADESGRLFEAEPKTVTPQQGNSFVVLTKALTETQAALVVIDTNGGYKRNGHGSWEEVDCQVEFIASGKGSGEMGGNISSWSQSLVVMQSGDVVKIRTSLGEVFYLEHRGEELKSFSSLEWNALKASAKAEAAMTTLEPLYGLMPVYTWVSSSLRPGIKTQERNGKFYVGVGDEGRGRHLSLVPVIGLQEPLTKAAVAKAGNGFALVASEQQQAGTFLVRVNTSGSYHRGDNGVLKVHRGNPEQIASGWFAQGDAGNVGSSADELWLLHEGDALYVQSEGAWYDGGRGHAGSASYILMVKSGQLQSIPYFDWKVEDARRNPEAWWERGWALAENVPTNWVGKVVEQLKADHSEAWGGGMVWAVKPTVRIHSEWSQKSHGQHPVTDIPQWTVWLKLAKDQPVPFDQSLIGTTEVGPEEVVIVQDFIPRMGTLECYIEKTDVGYTATAEVPAEVWQIKTEYVAGEPIPRKTDVFLRETTATHTFQVQLIDGFYGQLPGNYPVLAEVGTVTRGKGRRERTRVDIYRGAVNHVVLNAGQTGRPVEAKPEPEPKDSRAEAIEQALKPILGYVPEHGRYEDARAITLDEWKNGVKVGEFVDPVRALRDTPGQRTLPKGQIDEAMIGRVSFSTEIGFEFGGKWANLIRTIPCAGGTLELFLFNAGPRYDGRPGKAQLCGAIWKESLTEVEAGTPNETQAESKPVESVPFKVTDSKKGWYQCPVCNRQEQLQGDDREAFKNGQVVTVSCKSEQCQGKTVGTVQK